MAVVTTNLGVVTAYGDAVAAGYTGTKAEWQELMASYATVAEEAAQSATDAETAKNAAVTAKTGAETAKTDAIAAKTAAQAAQTAAETAQGAAEDAAESVSASAAQIATNTSDISDLKEGFTYVTGNEPLEFSDPSLHQYIVTNGTTVQWDSPSTSATTPTKWTVVNCAEGDVFTIYGQGGNADRLWTFADSSKTILSNADAGTNAVNGVVITAPTNSAYLIVNCENNKPSFKGKLLVDMVNAIPTEAQAVFCNDCAISVSSTSASISWSRIYIKLSGTEFDSSTTASYTLTNDNPILAIRNNSVVLLGTFGDVRPTDVILLVFRSGNLTGGVLYPYYLNGFTKKEYIPQAYFANDIKARMTIDGCVVSWTRLYIKLFDGEFNSNNSASFTLNNYNPIVVIRNKTTIQQLGLYGALLDTDIVLLVYRDGILTGGLLYPMCAHGLAESNNSLKFDDNAHLDVFRQTQQLANVKWTPLADVRSGEGTNPAGTEVTGVPYSSVKEYMKYVGIDVSLHTFMTAVNDIHSLFYTECPDAIESQSDYNRTYHGVNCYAYFGSVCSGFVTSGLGSKIQYNSWEYQTFPNEFEVLDNQDVLNLNVGDVLSYNGHCCIVTNIIRNEDGSIKYYQFDEHAAPIHVGENNTPYTLTARQVSAQGVWCRYKKISNNTKYKASPFILAENENLYNIGDFVYIDRPNSSRKYYRCKTPNRDSSWTESHWDEMPAFTSNTLYKLIPYTFVTYGENLYQCIKEHTSAATFASENWEKINGVFAWDAYPFVYNNDIVTFAGDRAAFHTNDLIYINYNKGSYTKMELFKDGSMIARIDLPESGYQMDVSSRCSSAGMYKARLTDLQNYSGFTYFEVIDSSVSATYGNGVATITFSSSNGKPIEWQIVEQSGATVCHMSITDKEAENGQVVVTPLAKMFAEKYIYPDRYTRYSNTKIYARIVFSGEYGNVVNPMIELGALTYSLGEIVYPNKPKDIGIISTQTKVYLADRMDGNIYTFTVMASGEVALDVVPAIGAISWLNTIPNTLDDGSKYLVTVDNGIGNILQVT